MFHILLLGSTFDNPIAEEEATKFLFRLPREWHVLSQNLTTLKAFVIGSATSATDQDKTDDTEDELQRQAEAIYKCVVANGNCI